MRVPAMRVLGGAVFAAILLIAVTLAPRLPLAETPVAAITDIAVEESSRGGELRIRFTEALEIEHFLLSDPVRLVIDFTPVRLETALDLFEDFEPVSAARFGLFQADRPRMVLDLTSLYSVAVSSRSEVEGAGVSEVVITLTEVDEATFESVAGWPEGARWEMEGPERLRDTGTDIIVAIDPGHGGFDPGATFEDLVEKDIVLDIARGIAERIEREPGFKPVLVRDADVFIPLRGRLDAAHRAQAHILISLHADSLTDGGANGMSIYTLSNEASDTAAEDFARRENRVDILAGADLVGETDTVTHLLLELSRRGTDAESDKLARSFLSAFRGRLDLLKTRPYRRAGFFVLKAPDIPSVLLELGFLSSEADRTRLTSPDFASTVAEAIIVGLLRWRAIADPAFKAPRN
ncbi:MAG: N-acetylmuramoyl-L-alanine amidase [Pseudomonadota bacterium]